jgi:NAD(P)-dependent dehydrogenase (short-subunit alcohol dehydrogenase family)
MAAANLLSLPLDVSVEERWVAAIAAAESRLGRIDIVVNNAGYGIRATIAEMTMAQWREVTGVCLDGTFLRIKHALPALRRTGGGAIVNISSMLGHVGIETGGAYCAAKAGVALLTKVAALEFAAAGDGIRVNSVHPGYIDTPLVRRRITERPEVEARMTSTTPSGRLGKPEEVAAAILYLASPEADFVNGTGLVIDGAYTAQ